MKVFAILDGGGVKGAALAGCLAAAEDRGIEIVAYGGASAGSIVALLASIGYKGPEIRDILLNEIEPRSLLDDNGVALKEAIQYHDRFTKILATNRAWPFKVCEVAKLVKEAWPSIKRLWTDAGLYPGQRFQEILEQKIVEKIPDLKGRDDITFEDLAGANCKPLKIVASDIETRRAAVFSRADTHYGNSVFFAVRASAGYPLLFQPVRLGNKRLVDGGLASNLPTFLFADEHEMMQYPILAFDLVATNTTTPGPYRLVDFGKQMLATALEASDDLFVRLMSGVFRIEIPIPPEIHTLKFVDLSRLEIEALYDRGYSATSQRLGEWEILKNASRAGGDLQKQLQAMHGDRKLFEPALGALAMMIEKATPARDLRSHVMLPTGRPDSTRIVTYFFGFRANDPDSDLELGEYAGCTGRALREHGPAFADLVDAQTNFAKWELTREQQAKVASDRRSMLSVPIFAWSEARSPDSSKWPIIGIVSVDSSTPLRDTGWLENIEDASQSQLKREVRDIMLAWADIISKLLR